jgi:hypothetical protein
MPNINNHSTNNIHFLGHSNIEYKSVGVGLHKDSSLMGFFPLPPPDPPHEVAMLNMVRTTVKQSSELFNPWVVLIPYATETSSLPHDLVPKPSLPPSVSIHPLW